jgi:hypothetical protein
MKTDHITIGRNPTLTYAILRGIAERSAVKQARRERLESIVGWFRNRKPAFGRKKN